TAKHDWLTGGLHAFHILGPLSCGFVVGNVRGVPRAPEQISRAILISLPKDVRGTRLNTRTTDLIFETARLVGKGDHQRHGDLSSLLGLGVDLFSLYLRGLCWFFLLS